MKKFINSIDDILDYSAEESGYSRELVEHVWRRFWESIRDRLSDPLTAKKGITIRGFARFFINPGKIKHVISQKKGAGIDTTYYDDLLKNYE